MNLARKILNNITVVLEASCFRVIRIYTVLLNKNSSNGDDTIVIFVSKFEECYYSTLFLGQLLVALDLWIFRSGLGFRVFTVHA